MTGMHGSEALNKFLGPQPNCYDLEFTRNLQKMLDQYSVDPVAREAISCSRIPSLLAESMRLAEGTAGKLAGLRAELIVTNGIGRYYCQPVTEMVSGSVSAVLTGEKYQFPFPMGSSTSMIQMGSANSSTTDGKVEKNPS